MEEDEEPHTPEHWRATEEFIHNIAAAALTLSGTLPSK